MITKADRIVTFKLITGEQLVAVLRDIGDEEITVEYPFVLRSFPKMVRSDRVEETITANAFCSFADDRVFTFREQDVMFLKDLSEHARPFYLNLYRDQEKLVETPEEAGYDSAEMAERIQGLIDRFSDEDGDWDEEMTELPKGTTVH
jgi:hypothetical protein